jgi:hypothetical protein
MSASSESNKIHPILWRDAAKSINASRGESLYPSFLGKRAGKLTATRQLSSIGILKNKPRSVL